MSLRTRASFQIETLAVPSLVQRAKKLGLRISHRVGNVLILKGAPVAQLDRAFDYESKGRVFESRRAHHIFQSFTASAFCRNYLTLPVSLPKWALGGRLSVSGGRLTQVRHMEG